MDTDRPNFRPDIEGLRAIAILLVVAAHAGVPWLAGGFIGVDVFFVLSGYLITRLLVGELERTNRMDIARFYARRFRRLLPALLLMLCLCMLLGTQLVPVTRQETQASAAAAAALWGSNLLFAFVQLDYFDADSSNNLFLHTWSLGVEEQFYLVWPLLLVAAYGAWRKSASPSRLNVIQLLWLVVGISFASCLFITSAEPRLAFYLMPLRAWQFALGGLAGLYFADSRSGNPGASPQVAVLGAAGLVGILITSIVLDGNVRYPGALALLPSLFTLAVLIGGARAPQAFAVRLLSHPALTAIGRVSYSWYLWHWPVLVFGRLVWPMPSPGLQLALVLGSLLMAWLSWKFVETPVRRNVPVIQSPRGVILGALLLMVFAVAGSFQWQVIAQQALSRPAYQRILQARMDVPALYRKQCDQWFRSDMLLPCEFGNRQASRTVVVLGDSIGLQWFPAIERIFDPAQWRIVVMTKSSCPIVDAPIFYARIGREYTECARWREAAMARIAEIAPDRVIIGSTQAYDFSPALWRDGTARVLHRLAPAAGRVHILRGTPMLPFDGPDCLVPRGRLWGQFVHTNCTTPAHNSDSDVVFRSLQMAASDFDNVRVVDMTSIVCPEGTCAAERNGTPIYRDERHLTANFVASLAPALAAELDQ
jgi:peptidoglycan/LPS O-acetylase OafA/YrhL